jgi:bifunctional NMN adenylyltransferase/nudix hydrolase
MKYDIALVVGRFQPYHNLHHKLINHALGLGDRVVIALGSAKTAPDVRNPFTPEMREKMMRACFDEGTNKRLKFVGLRDYPYNENTWISEVQNIVRNEQEENVILPEGDEARHNIELGKTKVCLVGHLKDESSYYLKVFPQWTFESFYENTAESKTINATDIRTMYLEMAEATSIPKQNRWDEIGKLVPAPVFNALYNFYGTEKYTTLVREHAYIEQYKKDSQPKLPFPPVFVTTDAVVTCKGHILVVRRGANPGKGLLALPGGFLDRGLTLKDNAVKELKEETRINLPASLLKGLIKDSEVFDYPQRSLRGRTVTHAYHIDINVKVEEGLPLVKGGDDAAKAYWLPLADLGINEDKFFEDHIDIIRHFTGLYS